jgi:hypothetical protein
MSSCVTTGPSFTTSGNTPAGFSLAGDPRPQHGQRGDFLRYMITSSVEFGVLADPLGA